MTHAISYWDLEFDRVPVDAVSSAGTPYVKHVKVGMPRIPQNVLNSVFYLYQTKEDAEAGRNPGGTGFIVRHDGMGGDMGGGYGTLYGVTNWHVACRGSSVIRMNTKDGGTESLDFNPDEWFFLPGKYDVAVVPLALDKIDAQSCVSTQMFAGQQIIPNVSHPRDVSVGDDTFMIGLFVDHGGEGVNVPSARFGNVSMLPNEKATIEQPNGYRGVSYVVDMHSQTGFSGSPVYVYRTLGSDLTRQHEGHAVDIQIDRMQTYGSAREGALQGRAKLRSDTMFKLLGIHWGQFPEKWELNDKRQLEESQKNHLILEGKYVEGMSGMTCVIPAWQIYEVLNMPELKKLRAANRVKSQASVLKPKAEAVNEAEDNPNAREDFSAMLDAAARKKDGS